MDADLLNQRQGSDCGSLRGCRRRPTRLRGNAGALTGPYTALRNAINEEMRLGGVNLVNHEALVHAAKDAISAVLTAATKAIAAKTKI